MTQHVARVVGVTPDDDSVHVGRVVAFTVDFLAAEDFGISPDDVLDTDAALHCYTSLLGRVEGSYSAAAGKVLGLDEDDAFVSSMFVLDRVEVAPGYRGRDLGLQAISLMVSEVGQGCAIAAMKPFPLQFEKTMVASIYPCQGFNGNQSSSTLRLRKHYARLGFKQVPRTDLMVIDLRAFDPAAWRGSVPEIRRGAARGVDRVRPISKMT